MATAVSHLTNRQTRTDPGSHRLAWQSLGRMLGVWRARIRDRQRLMQFDQRELGELGIPRWAIEQEMAKHFWQD